MRRMYELFKDQLKLSKESAAWLMTIFSMLIGAAVPALICVVLGAGGYIATLSSLGAIILGLTAFLQVLNL